MGSFCESSWRRAFDSGEGLRSEDRLRDMVLRGSHVRCYMGREVKVWFQSLSRLKEGGSEQEDERKKGSVGMFVFDGAHRHT